MPSARSLSPHARKIAKIYLHFFEAFGLRHTHGCDRGKHTSICERFECGIRMLPKVRWPTRPSDGRVLQDSWSKTRTPTSRSNGKGGLVSYADVKTFGHPPLGFLGLGIRK